MNNKKHPQIISQEKRWDARAKKWDEYIKYKEFYTNFEEGYEKFIKLEKNILQRNKNLDIGLDIGCGTGETSKILSEYVKKIYLLDISKEMLKIAKRKVPQAITIHSSATNIPLKNNSVDIVISRGVVISHLPEDIYISFFKELERIIKNKGVILFDYISNMENVNFPPTSKKIVFSKEEIKEYLLDHGFYKIKIYGGKNQRVSRVYAIKK